MSTAGDSIRDKQQLADAMKLVRTEGAHPWDAALSRVLAVLTGCLVGLGVTYAFHATIRIEVPAVNSEAPRAPPTSRKDGEA